MESSRGPPRVKNKAAAPVQISAEQLLREAVDRQETAIQKPTQRFEDLEELKEYQGRKRREFEDYIRRNRVRLANWFQYAQWELEQKEFARARSVFERALDVHPNNTRKSSISFAMKEKGNGERAQSLTGRRRALDQVRRGRDQESKYQPCAQPP